MPNLINQDGAGNTFYNYITPVELGAITGSSSLTMADQILNAWQSNGSGTFAISGSNRAMIFNNPLESITSPVSVSLYRYLGVSNGRWPGQGDLLNSSNGNTTVNISTPSNSGPFSGTHKVFSVINNYAMVQATFDATLNTFVQFHYAGFLREPVFTGSSFPLGLIKISSVNGSTRVLSANSILATALSTAADAITSPPIVCTPGTDPGDGSETFTDIVIRDADAPNNPVGKLWNCIDMPATCNVGELWKNVGAYDGDGVASDQDVYLCVMPWGERKLGMRVWTENVF